MENATKALLIAAAIILLTLIISLLVMAYGQASDFFKRQSESTVVEQLERFNKQFDNYNGTTIRGNEMLSMINKVIDYNTLQAEDNGYDKIELQIKGIDSETIKNQFKSSNEEDFILDMEDINTNGSKVLSNLVNNLLSSLRGDIKHIQESHLQTLEANMSDVLIEGTDTENYEVKKRNSLIKTTLNKNLEEDDNAEELLEKIQEATKKYHQLVQFKRAYFKCTNIEHSDETGRVIKMEFELVVNGGTVKFD